MPDFLTAPRGDLIRLIYDLIDENDALKIQIVELRKLIKKQGPPKEASSSLLVKPSIKRKKKKTKRRKRMLNFARRREKPTKQVFHSYDVCPKCHGLLGKPAVAFTRQVIDIPLPKVEVTEHVFFKRWCTNCQERVYPQVKKGTTIGKQRFGINLTSLVAALNEEFRQPLNKIKSFLAITYNLEISEGGIVRLLQSTGKKGKREQDRIQKNLRKSSVVYADETGSRQDGVNGYQWSFSNDDYQLVWYHKRRNKDVVREFVGEENEKGSFEGVLVSDFLGSYNEYNGFHQRCWVHLLRDVKNLQRKLAANIHPLIFGQRK